MSSIDAKKLPALFTKGREGQGFRNMSRSVFANGAQPTLPPAPGASENLHKIFSCIATSDKSHKSPNAAPCRQKIAHSENCTLACDSRIQQRPIYRLHQTAHVWEQLYRTLASSHLASEKINSAYPGYRQEGKRPLWKNILK